MQKGKRLAFDLKRLNIIYSLVIIIFLVFTVRLFYLQVLQQKHYRELALSNQYREYEIPANRGMILGHDGENTVPLVLNEEKFTLFADPKYIQDTDRVAQELCKVTGDKPQDYASLMKKPTRYVVLAKKLGKDKKDQINNLDLKGVGFKTESVRTYPQGNLAAQILGFVNNDGVGTYGVEQALDNQLKGKPGELKAITDVNGVPLEATGDNVRIEPKEGEDVTLTIDVGLQRRLEDILSKHVPSVNSKSGSAIILDPNTGAVKAMANYPSYNISEFYKVKDASSFNNKAVSQPSELGSVMKTLTIATALNEKVIKPNQTYADPAKWRIDGSTIENVEEDGGPAIRSIGDILKYSLNTGAVYALMQMGGGKINSQARNMWHDYLVNHYYFGQKTGIEQGYEADGYIPDPNKGWGLDLQYANMSFGQGMNVTPIQFASAYASTINGGVYYKPHLVDKKPEVANSSVISPSVSKQMRAYQENSVQTHYYGLIRKGYKTGGKTGTAEVPKPGGGYYTDRYDGTFVGFVGGDKPQYVIFVRVSTPMIPGYAGTEAGLSLFSKIEDMLINNFSLMPTS